MSEEDLFGSYEQLQGGPYTYNPGDDYDDDDYDLHEYDIQASNPYFQDGINLDIEQDYGEVEEIKLVGDETYAEMMGFPNPVQFPNSACVEDDLCAFVAGVLMAKSNKLDTGLTSEEFDFILQEVTGKREGTTANYMELRHLSAFIRLSPDEIDKSLKEKGNILLNRIFADIIQFNVTDATFRIKIDEHEALRELYEDIKKGGANRKRRQEKAEQLKNDKMSYLENRRKYMISNNFLVELIARALDKEYLQMVDYEKIRSVYRKMMFDEDNDILYRKYNPLLNLAKLKEEIGEELNQHAVRDLFGRGTITKALSNPIYKEIDWSNDGKILFKRIRHKTLDEITYSKEDFDEINEAIELRNREKKPQRNRDHQPNREEREAIEREERRKTYEPVNLNSVNIFIPGSQHEEAPTFFGRTANDHESATNTTRSDTVETVNNKYNSPPNLEKLLSENTVPHEHMAAQHSFFARSRRVVTETCNAAPKPSSPVSEKSEILYTSDEEKERVPKPKKEKFNKENLFMNRDRSSSPRPSPGGWDVPLHVSRKGNILPAPTPLPNSTMQTKPANENTESIFRSNTVRESSRHSRPRSPFMAKDGTQPISAPQPVLLPTDEYQEPLNNNSSPMNPLIMTERAVFLNYMVAHIYLHRHPEGAPRRHWSQIQRYLDSPYNRPDVIFGQHWEEFLQRNPNINITQICNGSDILFEWVSSDNDVPSSICSRMRC